MFQKINRKGVILGPIMLFALMITISIAAKVIVPRIQYMNLKNDVHLWVKKEENLAKLTAMYIIKDGYNAIEGKLNYETKVVEEADQLQKLYVMLQASDLTKMESSSFSHIWGKPTISVSTKSIKVYPNFDDIENTMLSIWQSFGGELGQDGQGHYREYFFGENIIELNGMIAVAKERAKALGLLMGKSMGISRPANSNGNYWYLINPMSDTARIMVYDSARKQNLPSTAPKELTCEYNAQNNTYESGGCQNGWVTLSVRKMSTGMPATYEPFIFSTTQSPSVAMDIYPAKIVPPGSILYAGDGKSYYSIGSSWVQR